MATDPLKPELNRALQIKTDEQYRKSGIKLMDVDRAIMEHIEDTVLPTLTINDEPVKVPLIYGSAERWKSIRIDGFLRDKDGQIQIPLTVLKRTSVESNDDLPNPVNRKVSYPAISAYSKKHKYDLFSKMSGFSRPQEQYNVTIPDYVTMSYEIIIWTDFTEHMNTVVEAFQYASDTYWGDKFGFKFMTKVSSFDTSSELGDGSQRIIKTTFTLEVKAYLLPEKFDNQPTTQKAFTPKKVLWNTYVSGVNGRSDTRADEQIIQLTNTGDANPYNGFVYDFGDAEDFNGEDFDGGNADGWE